MGSVRQRGMMASTILSHINDHGHGSLPPSHIGTDLNRCEVGNQTTMKIVRCTNKDAFTIPEAPKTDRIMQVGRVEGAPSCTGVCTVG